MSEDFLFCDSPHFFSHKIFFFSFSYDASIFLLLFICFIIFMFLLWFYFPFLSTDLHLINLPSSSLSVVSLSRLQAARIGSVFRRRRQFPAPSFSGSFLLQWKRKMNREQIITFYSPTFPHMTTGYKKKSKKNTKALSPLSLLLTFTPHHINAEDKIVQTPPEQNKNRIYIFYCSL